MKTTLFKVYTNGGKRPVCEVPVTDELLVNLDALTDDCCCVDYKFVCNYCDNGNDEGIYELDTKTFDNEYNGFYLCEECVIDIFTTDIANISNVLSQHYVNDTQEEEEKEEEIINEQEEEEIRNTFKDVLENVGASIQDKILQMMNCNNKDCIDKAITALATGMGKVNNSKLTRRVRNCITGLISKKEELKENSKDVNEELTLLNKLGIKLKAIVKQAIEIAKAVFTTAFYTTLGIGIATTKTAIHVGTEAYDLGKTVVNTVKQETKKTSWWKNKTEKKANKAKDKAYFNNLF